jgi:hypothetical protein
MNQKNEFFTSVVAAVWHVFFLALFLSGIVIFLPDFATSGSVFSGVVGLMSSVFALRLVYTGCPMCWHYKVVRENNDRQNQNPRPN